MRRWQAWAFIAGCGALAASVLTLQVASAWSQSALERHVSARDFARPNTVPIPPGNPGTLQQIALGATLFTDPRLSRDGSTSCATCHNPDLGFTDGASRGKGVAGVTLKRNTPTLWNLAWGDSFFWDGRAATLEDQARGPIEHPLEMDMPLSRAAAVLNADPKAVTAFTQAFGGGSVTETNILKALAAYERTLISPKTRFDRWAEGDEQALIPAEKKGFELFTGRAGCAKCHNTWRFTDEAYHDIGLPGGEDKGRGAAAGQPQMNYAFKTPTLRELVWTAPFMHDGSLATIEAANDHYFGGIENLRSTLSKDLQVIVPVSTAQRNQLTAFLRTLSSDTPPQPVSLKPSVRTIEDAVPVAASEISQRDNNFTPRAVRIRKGQPLTIRNDDDRTHALRADGPGLSFSSEPQEPGHDIVLTFPKAGTYTVTCNIHPKVKLQVYVTE